MEKFDVRDTILHPLTYYDLVVMAQSINPSNGSVQQLLRKELCNLLMQKKAVCLALFDEHIEDIMADAFPDEQEMQHDPRFSEEICQEMAQRICEFLLKYEMWQDVCIYFNGKRMTTSSKNEFRYNGEPFIEEDKKPNDYFEYVCTPHILSMSFEGPLYECINGYSGKHGWEIKEEFCKLLGMYGCHFELGNEWNLSCYPNDVNLGFMRS